MRDGVAKGALAAAICAALFAAEPAQAAIRALVIGIDDYGTLQDLDGAVNDAKDLEEALSGLGADPVVTLLNEDATRDNILAAWRRLAEGAAAGDILFVTYAGHGGQEPARQTGGAVEADARDETLLLSRFSQSGPGTYERIRDDEIAGLVAIRPDVSVVLVIDACHSGGMTRSIDRRAAQGKVRFSAYRVEKDDLLPPPPPPSTTAAAAEVPANLAFIGAVQENELVPEKQIEGQPRGALSWSVARALRGDADFDQDGDLTHKEVERFVRNAVRTQMDGRQHPLFEFGSTMNAGLLRGTPADGGGAPAPAAAPLPVIGVSFSDLSREQAESEMSGLQGAELRPKEQADLLISLKQRVAVTALGDIVADDLGGGQPLQAVVDRTRFLQWTKAVGLKRPLRVDVRPGDRRFTEGERLSIEVAAYDNPALAVVNLAPGGIIQFLYPALAGDTLLVEPGRGISFDAEATAPFGSNAIIAIASQEPLPQLHEELKRLDGTADIAALHASLVRALDGQRFELGGAQVFTGRAD